MSTVTADVQSKSHSRSERVSGLDPLSTTQPSARRRPTAIVAVWLVELCLGFLFARPWVEFVGAIYGKHPDGDRALFLAKGHIALADFAARHATQISGLFRASIWWLVGFWVVSIIPLGALLVTLSDEHSPSVSNAVSRAVARFGRLLVIQFVGAIGLVATLLLLVKLPLSLLDGPLSNMDPRWALVIRLLPLAVGLLGVGLLLAAMDLSRARVMRHGDGSLAAMALALRGGQIRSQLVDSLPRWLASIGALGFGMAITHVTLSVLLAWCVHQGFALFRVGLRASVLARALRHSDLLSPRLKSVSGESTNVATSS